MTKKFNPKRCPYNQILSHKGVCFVVVSRRGILDRARVLSPHPFEIVYGAPVFCLYTRINPWLEVISFEESCFSVGLTNFKQVIKEMKAYDKVGLKIIHIDFM